MGATGLAAAQPPGALGAAKIRLNKWISRHLPAPIVYRILIGTTSTYTQQIFREGFAAADPAKTAVDIGANRGLVSYHMSKRFARVESFEPNAELGAFLEKVLPANCTLHRCALSDAPGETELSVALEAGVPIHGRGRILEGARPGAVRTSDFAVQKIRLETLDSLGLANVGIIKIDVEGHEEKVIRGGLKTLRENRPVLIIEIEKRHTRKPAGESIAFIESLGYRGYFFENGQRRPAREFEERMQDPGYSAYINDFLFLPQ